MTQTAKGVPPYIGDKLPKFFLCGTNVSISQVTWPLMKRGIKACKQVHIDLVELSPPNCDQSM